MTTEPRLLGQTVVVIGGSAGIGLETARLARSEGADVVLTGRNPERLEQAARELSARSSAAFDADDAAARQALLRRAARADRPRARRGIHAQVVRAHARKPLRGGGPRRRPARDAGPRDRAPRGPQDAARRHAAADGRQREEVRSRVRDNPRRVRGAAALHRGARAGAGPGARQPHPSRLRRHRAGGVVLRRRRQRSRPGARSCAPPCRSGASSDRPTSPPSPFTS